MVCVASTSRTWVVPMPNAIAPNAPWVAVWRVAAGDGRARLGDALLRADDVDDALLAAAEVEIGDAEVLRVLAQLLRSSPRRAGRRRAPPGCRSGTMWSTVANVRCGNVTFSPRSRSMPKACGLVTSWMRCVPMRSCVCPLASVRDGVCVPDFFEEGFAHDRRSRRLRRARRLAWFMGRAITALSAPRSSRACGCPASRTQGADSRRFAGAAAIRNTFAQESSLRAVSTPPCVPCFFSFRRSLSSSCQPLPRRVRVQRSRTSCSSWRMICGTLAGRSRRRS